MNWEKIDDHHERAKVFGGWMFKAYSDVYHNLSESARGMVEGWEFRIALQFIPDPNHEWILEEIEK